MTVESKTGRTAPRNFRQFGLAALILTGALAILFRQALVPENTMFNNDGPLGAISSECANTWASFTGPWTDLNWLGSAGVSATPTISTSLVLLTGSLIFSKIYAPFSLLFVGLGAWFCFRQWKFTPLACILGGIAVALNGDFLPTTCWGVCSQPIAFGLSYLALGALADTTSPKRWLRVVLAGFAVGMNVMEAFDIGALFSVTVAAFVVFQAFAGEGSLARKAVTGFTRLGIVAVFAGFIAIATLTTLIGTQIKGVGGMAQDADTKARRWDEATMWSLPKSEAFGIVVPGLFGYRMDTPDGGAYWGKVGRHPVWDRYFDSGKQGQPPEAPIRYGGGSGYAGALVVVVALWAVVQSFRKSGSVFSIFQRRMIWFWLAMVFVSMLLAFGRFAPFYQFFYALPYASTIRNPAKFLHILEWALLILFAYGADALSRNFLQATAAAPRDWMDQWKTWWAKASGFDRKWIKGSALGLAGGLAAWGMYAASRSKLIAHLQEVGFEDPGTSAALASFSVRQMGWGILLIAVALGLVALVIAGCFNGKRARTGGIVLGVFLALDLAIFAGPWIITYNWKDRLQTNPVVDLLRQRPYESRVTIFPLDRFLDFRRLPPELRPVANQFQNLNQIYGYEWKQHLFLYLNIQNLDIIQEPRMGADKMAYESALSSAPALRRWELTNTRYLFGPTALFSLLNQQLDAEKKRFRIAAAFDLVPKPGVISATRPDQITTVLNPNGQYALFEFTGALPRAKLYANWQVSTNDPAALQTWRQSLAPRVPPEFSEALANVSTNDLATLKQLADPNFDPTQTVLVAAEDAPPASAVVATNQDAGTVEYVSYAPRRIVLRAKAATAAVLLLNDRYNPGWRVTVDGKPAPLLRCNFIVRGVQLSPGEHAVEFSFSTPSNALYVSLAAIGLGVLLLGFLGLVKNRAPEKNDPTTPAPKPAKK